MIESSDAAAVKPSTLAKPPTTEWQASHSPYLMCFCACFADLSKVVQLFASKMRLEVRLVIWTASGVKLMRLGIRATGAQYNVLGSFSRELATLEEWRCDKCANSHSA